MLKTTYQIKYNPDINEDNPQFLSEIKISEFTFKPKFYFDDDSLTMQLTIDKLPFIYEKLILQYNITVLDFDYHDNGEILYKQDKLISSEYEIGFDPEDDLIIDLEIGLEIISIQKNINNLYQVMSIQFDDNRENLIAYKNNMIKLMDSFSQDLSETIKNIEFLVDEEQNLRQLQQKYVAENIQLIANVRKSLVEYNASKKKKVELDRKIKNRNLENFFRNFDQSQIDISQFKAPELYQLLNNILNIQLHLTKKIDESELCTVCMENPRNIALIPCGHYNFCSDCRKNIKKTCPVCTSPINQIITIHN